jgi:hypothetical protein
MSSLSDQRAWFSRDGFFSLFEIGWIVDGRAGGLVLGRDKNPTEEIGMLQQVEADKFALCGWMHGAEYLVNADAVAEFKERLEEINAYKSTSNAITAIPIGRSCRILNTHAAPDEKFVWVEGFQFVVNAAATAKYFDEIVTINESRNRWLSCDHSTLIRKHESEETGDAASPMP